MMDTIIHDLILTNEVIVYMDDILIAMSSNITHHQEMVHQILYQLEEHDLYLNPEKLLFAARFCPIAHLCVYTMLQVILPYLDSLVRLIYPAEDRKMTLSLISSSAGE